MLSLEAIVLGLEPLLDHARDFFSRRFDLVLQSGPG
jgi:hypothetical protein